MDDVLATSTVVCNLSEGTRLIVSKQVYSSIGHYSPLSEQTAYRPNSLPSGLISPAIRLTKSVSRLTLSLLWS